MCWNFYWKLMNVLLQNLKKKKDFEVLCPEAGPSLDMHYQGSTYLSLLDKRNEWGNMSSPFLTEPVALWEYLLLHTQTQECCKYNY